MKHFLHSGQPLNIPITLFLFSFLVSIGCSEETRSVRDQAVSTPTIHVKDGSGLLFTFFNHKGQLLTVDRIAEVEQEARGEVEVINPKRSLSGGRIFVADLRKRLDTGKFRTWIEPRGAWLQRNMPKVTLLEKPIVVAAAPKKVKPRKKRRRKKRPKHNRPAVAAAAAQPAQQPIAQPAQQTAPKVFVFSTSWCPSCRQACAYFRSRKIPFVELDVEKNPQAAQQYMAVCQRAGLKQGAVPVIIIDGQVFQGFSRLQIEGALARAGL